MANLAQKDIAQLGGFRSWRSVLALQSPLRLTFAFGNSPFGAFYGRRVGTDIRLMLKGRRKGRIRGPVPTFHERFVARYP